MVWEVGMWINLLSISIYFNLGVAGLGLLGDGVSKLGIHDERY